MAGPPFLFERSPVSEEIGYLRKDIGQKVFPTETSPLVNGVIACRGAKKRPWMRQSSLPNDKIGPALP